MTVASLIELLSRVENKNAEIMLVAGNCTHYVDSLDVNGMNKLGEWSYVCKLVQQHDRVMGRTPKGE